MSESKRQEWAARLQRFQENPSSIAAFCRTEGVSSETCSEPTLCHTSIAGR